MTIFLVARNNGPGVGFILGPGAVDNNQIRYENSTQILSVGTGNGLDIITSTIGNNQVHHSLTIRYDGVTWEVWRDGVLASSTPEGRTGPLVLGRLGSWFGGQFGLVGEIAEVMVYDVALDAGERVAVEAYLRGKYALCAAIAREHAQAGCRAHGGNIGVLRFGEDRRRRAGERLDCLNFRCVESPSSRRCIRIYMVHD